MERPFERGPTDNLDQLALSLRSKMSMRPERHPWLLAFTNASYERDFRAGAFARGLNLALYLAFSAAVFSALLLLLDAYSFPDVDVDARLLPLLLSARLAGASVWLLPGFWLLWRRDHAAEGAAGELVATRRVQAAASALFSTCVLA